MVPTDPYLLIFMHYPFPLNIEWIYQLISSKQNMAKLCDVTSKIRLEKGCGFHLGHVSFALPWIAHLGEHSCHVVRHPCVGHTSEGSMPANKV